MKREAVSHPKVKRLATLLGVRQYGAVGILEMLWKFTAQHAPRGDVGRWADEEIADAVDWPTDDAGRLVDALLDARLVDESDQHRLVIHDWSEHCEDSTHLTLARKTERFADGKMPSLVRLSAADRAKISTAFAEKEKGVETHGMHTNAHGTRAETHECTQKPTTRTRTRTRPLPEPVPKPVSASSAPAEAVTRIDSGAEATDLAADFCTKDEDAARLSTRLRQRARYAGDDGEIFDQVGELVASNQVPEAVAMESAAAAAGKDNVPGYFRTTLANAIGGVPRLRLLLLHSGRREVQS